MQLEDFTKSINELPEQEAVQLIRESRVSRHKKPEKKKKKRSSGGGSRKKGPETLDEIFTALTREQQKEMLKKLEDQKKDG